MSSKTKLTIGMLLFCGVALFGQMREYNYQRKLSGISETWHKIVLPDSIYAETNAELSDLRVYGVTEENDTVQAPYVLRDRRGKHKKTPVSFNLINRVSNVEAYFFTYELPTPEPINKIALDFNNRNFDWLIRLEGSQNQKQWFTIADKYRILSINNHATSYTFNELEFPKARYRFYRIRIPTGLEKPELIRANIFLNHKTEGRYRKYNLRNLKIRQDNNQRQTIITGELPLAVPLNYIEVDVKDKIDYYRPINIYQITDSIETPKGWLYDEKWLGSYVLNSIEENKFYLESHHTKKIKIVIDNFDNEPLETGTVKAGGYLHEMHVRFSKQADYYLTYGNTRASWPNYDINRGHLKIPDSLSALNLGTAILMKNQEGFEATQPLITNMLWLWVIMGLIIAVLGWFSVKMIRKS